MDGFDAEQHNQHTRTVLDAKFICSTLFLATIILVTRTFKTKLKDISNIASLPDGSVVATGFGTGTPAHRELVKYSMETGEELWNTELRENVWGIAPTDLGGKPCLALSNE